METLLLKRDIMSKLVDSIEPRPTNVALQRDWGLGDRKARGCFFSNIRDSQILHASS